MKKNVLFLILLTVITYAEAAGVVRLNQLGFEPNAVKKAVYVQTSPGATLTVRNTDNPDAVVKTLYPTESKQWEFSGEYAGILDFSDIDTPGNYAIYENDVKISETFKIESDIYTNLLKSLFKWYYYQRASTALTEEYAGIHSREAGHPDTNIKYWPESDRPDLLISSPKGWYDAGDYNKYIVNSGITVYTLLDTYERFPELFNELKWNIPPDGSLPDVLAEIKWNLDWMLTMQDTDGGVFHKLSGREFSGVIMPENYDAERYVVMKTTAATYDFAAVTAMASRIYAPFNEQFAEQCRIAAINAFQWAEANPDVRYRQPQGMSTGEYGDNSFTDERIWAVVSLAIIDNNPLYMGVVDEIITTPRRWINTTPTWGNVGTLATYEVCKHPEIFGETRFNGARNKLLEKADELAMNSLISAYGLSLSNSTFVWGSNSAVGNEAIIMLYGYYLTDERYFLDAAQASLDYLLGRNPLNMLYVTGIGNNSPMRPHHRVSGADGITEPVPGMVAGGPHGGGNDVGSASWLCDNYVVPGKPALSYLDEYCSYATNEVAINWNAPVAYLTTAIHSLTKLVEKPPVNIRNQTENTQGVKIYLASGSNELQIECPYTIYNTYIFDIYGKMIKSEGGNRLNLSGFPKGIYIIKVETNAGDFVLKLLRRY